MTNRPPGPSSSSKSRWFVYLIPAIPIIALIIVVVANFVGYDSEAPTPKPQGDRVVFDAPIPTPTRDTEPGPFDALGVELVMSDVCDDDLALWERFLLWLAGDTPQLVDDPTDDAEVAFMMAFLPYICDFWRSHGNWTFAALGKGDPEAKAAYDQYVGGLDLAAIRAEAKRIEADLPAIRDAQRYSKVTGQ